MDYSLKHFCFGLCTELMLFKWGIKRQWAFHLPGRQVHHDADRESGISLATGQKKKGIKKE